jgi:hypothetical protein
VKRLLMLCLLLCVAVPAWAQLYIRGGGLSESWTASLTGIAASLTELKAVPLTAASRHYITDIVVQTTTGTTGTYALRYGTGTNCATGTGQLFPSSGSGSDRYNAPINSQPTAHIKFTTPLVVPAGNAICLIGVGTNTISIQINGFTTP